ncbi:MAG: lysylphosphatidylglycerol synthase transmembrane domain-containing protein [Flavobacteriales bacterium]
MRFDDNQILRSFSTGRVLLPVVIGLGITVILIWRGTDLAALHRVEWTWTSTFWIALAALSVGVRDYAYMVRIRHLTDRQLSWWRTFVVIMLWEFSSALAPGIIGGGFLFAIFILTREGIEGGKSITIITFTSFLDGIFLAVMAPLVYFVVGRDALFSGIEEHTSPLGSGFFVSFWTIYFGILAYKLFVGYALFVNPLFVKRALVGIFSAPFLRRWRRSMVTTGDQLITAASGLRQKKWNYWWPALLATFVSWTARYSIVNCILHAFQPGQLNDAVIYGKQVVMGIIILLSPTPGGAGLAEFIFDDFLGLFIATGLAPALALLWRLISYYPYIIMGVFLLPRWVRRNLLRLDSAKTPATTPP